MFGSADAKLMVCGVPSKKLTAPPTVVPLKVMTSAAGASPAARARAERSDPLTASSPTLLTVMVRGIATRKLPIVPPGTKPLTSDTWLAFMTIV
jgi:hypothetical protein